ncbi:MAG: hypothetical protein OEL84_02760 [Nitrosopumilus sp.]|nr:hypothetical protein [Nitrosopumilus sp.]
MKEKFHVFLIFLSIVVLIVNFDSINGEEESIPNWIKNIFVWYGQDLVSESELINALQFLIKQNIIVFDYFETSEILDSDYIVIPEGCNTEEYYDVIYQLCLPSCTLEYNECQILEEQTSEKSNSIWERESTKEFSEEHPDELQIIAIYAVKDNNLTKLPDPLVYDDLKTWQNDSDKHKEVWEFFVNLFPKHYIEDVVLYTVYTDGIDNELAAVQRYLYNSQKSELMMDIPDFYNSDKLDESELSFFLIHEFGHLITMGTSQMEIDDELLYGFTYLSHEEYSELFSKKYDACYPQYLTLDGCTNAESYLNIFFQRFWNDTYDEYLSIQSIEDDDEYYDAIERFYEKYIDWFVTDYALTNPDEDIAESWLAFVLNDKPDGNSVAEEKILFFYDYPELIKLRDYIRNRL